MGDTDLEAASVPSPKLAIYLSIKGFLPRLGDPLTDVILQSRYERLAGQILRLGPSYC